MRTQEKYKELKLVKISNIKVQDKHGHVYYPRKVTKPLKAIRQNRFRYEALDVFQRSSRHLLNLGILRRRET